MADLLNVGLKMRESLFRELAPKFPSEGGAMSLTPLPPGKCTSIFGRGIVGKWISSPWPQEANLLWVKTYPLTLSVCMGDKLTAINKLKRVPKKDGP